MLFVTANLCPHLYCKYSSFTRRTNDSTTSKLVVSSHDEAAAFPTIPSTSRLCGARMGPGRDVLSSPPALLPRLLRGAWQRAALFVSPSFPLFLTPVLCLPGFSFFFLLASIITLLALPSSFLLHGCPHRIPGISNCPPPALSSYFHHPLPLPSVGSAIPLLPSVFPAAIRANQIPEQLCKAISGFPLIPRGGEQSWTIRLFHAAPSLINTINNTGRWAHLCHQCNRTGHGPASIPGRAGCPTVGRGAWGAPGSTPGCPPSDPAPDHPVLGAWGAAFWGGTASPAGPMHGVCCREFPCLLRSPAHPSCCWIYELCVCFVIKQLIALEFLISFGGW